MQWDTWWGYLAGNLGVGAVLLAAFLWLTRKWIGVRIAEFVRHEYARRLEEHKAQLQAQLNERIRQVEADMQSAADQRVSDQRLYNELVRALPSQGTMEFIATSPMDVVPWSIIRHLQAFRRLWGDPEHEFLDEEVDQKRKHLHECVSRLLESTAINLAPSKRDPEFLVQVPFPDRSPPPKQLEEEREEMGRLADAVVAAHRDFVRTARARLNR